MKNEDSYYSSWQYYSEKKTIKKKIHIRGLYLIYVDARWHQPSLIAESQPVLTAISSLLSVKFKG